MNPYDINPHLDAGSGLRPDDPDIDLDDATDIHTYFTMVNSIDTLISERNRATLIASMRARVTLERVWEDRRRRSVLAGSQKYATGSLWTPAAYADIFEHHAHPKPNRERTPGLVFLEHVVPTETIIAVLRGLVASGAGPADLINPMYVLFQHVMVTRTDDKKLFSRVFSPSQRKRLVKMALASPSPLSTGDASSTDELARFIWSRYPRDLITSLIVPDRL